MSCLSLAGTSFDACPSSSASHELVPGHADHWRCRAAQDVARRLGLRVPVRIVEGMDVRSDGGSITLGRLLVDTASHDLLTALVSRVTTPGGGADPRRSGALSSLVAAQVITPHVRDQLERVRDLEVGSIAAVCAILESRLRQLACPVRGKPARVEPGHEWSHADLAETLGVLLEAARDIRQVKELARRPCRG